MAIENEVGDPEKREKLKKMIEGLDAKGMDSMMNQMLNYGGGSTYKMYGDTEASDIEFAKDYESEAGAKLGRGTFEGGGTGSSGKTSWANLLIDTANQRGVKPPEKFWFDDRVYNLNATEAPVYTTEEYDVQVPNPDYRAPQAPKEQKKEEPRQPSYSRDYLAWLDSQRIKSDQAGDRMLQEKYNKITGRSAFEGEPRKPADPRLPQLPQLPGEPQKQQAPQAPQAPQFITETRTREVQTGTEWRLADVGADVF